MRRCGGAEMAHTIYPRGVAQRQKVRPALESRVSRRGVSPPLNDSASPPRALPRCCATRPTRRSSPSAPRATAAAAAAARPPLARAAARATAVVEAARRRRRAASSRRSGSSSWTRSTARVGRHGPRRLLLSWWCRDPTLTRHAVLMDEVDGMSGNSDRGGTQELIAVIKKSKVPFICICNDRQSTKVGVTKGVTKKKGPRANARAIRR